MNNDSKRGGRLCRAMSSKKVTVRELAEKIGMSTGFVSEARNGSDIKISQAMKICQVLEIEIHWLLYGEDILSLDESKMLSVLRWTPLSRQEISFFK